MLRTECRTMLTLTEFTKLRRPYETQYFPTPDPTPHTRTIMVSSHIWWTDHLALAILNSGHNVLIHYALYILYTEDAAWNQFDLCWNQILQTIREHKVDLILAGNATALVPHPRTG